MADKPSRVEQAQKWIDSKLKLKNAFITYIAVTLLYLGSSGFLNGLTATTDYVRAVWLSTTVIGSVIIIIILGDYDYRMEDKNDEIQSNKNLRNPKEIKHQMEQMMRYLNIITEKPVTELDDKSTSEIRSILNKAEETLNATKKE